MQQVTRRAVLGLLGTTAAAALLAACGGQAPQAPTTAPAAGAKPAAAEPTKPAAGAAPAATSAPGAAATAAPAAGAGAPAAAATATPTVAPVSFGQGTKLTLWHYWGGLLGESVNKLIKEWAEKSGKYQVEVTFTEPAQLLRKWQTAIAGDALPDAGQGDLIWIPILQKTGKLVALDDALKAKGVDTKDFIQSILQYDIGPDGKIYAQPLSTNNIQLFYNKKLVAESGLDWDKNPPKTWDELAQQTAKITNADKKTWGIIAGVNTTQGSQGALAIRHMCYTWQSGVDYFAKDSQGREERGNPVFNSEKAVAAWQWYADLINKYKAMPLQPPQDGFQTGFVGATYTGPWNIRTYQQQIGSKFEMGVFDHPGPTPQGAGHSWSGGEHFFSLKNKQNYQDATQDLVLWLTSKEQVERFAIDSGFIPTRTSALEGDTYKKFLEQNPLWKPFAANMAKTHPRTPTPLFDKVSIAISQHLENIIFQKGTAKDELDAAVKDVLNIYADEGYKP